MIEIKEKSYCTGCTACKQICRHNAIEMCYDEYGHLYPKVLKDKCVMCNLCEKVCPVSHKLQFDKPLQLQSYAAYTKNQKQRNTSTSGGIFSILSEYTINNDGIVYAARFDEKYHIRHSSFSSMDEIEPFKGSKYAQSDLSNIFIEIRNYLIKNKLVLFVGCPCQVAGLKSFLSKDYENLITCDFICMSISSPKIWEEYLKYFWNVNNITKIVFKDKVNGWHHGYWKMLIEDDKGKHYSEWENDPFFSSYIKRLSARPSCFNCAFRQVSHISDFTISDCWGVDKVIPEFDDNLGCSSVILQSNKAKDIFDAICSKINYTTFSISNIVKYNHYLVDSIKKPIMYDVFNNCYVKEGAYKTLLKFTQSPNKSLFHNLLGFIKKYV